MVTIIVGIVGFIFGFLVASVGVSRLIVGTILLDRDDTLYVELDDEKTQKKMDMFKMVAFRIKRR